MNQTIIGTLNILKAAQKYNVKHVVITGTMLSCIK